MRERIFISNVVPKNQVVDLDVSAAANYFSYNLIDANLFQKNYSLVPTNIYKKIENNKRNDLIFFKTRLFNNKGLFKLLNVLIDNFKIFRLINKNSSVWFYNLTSQNIFLYFLLKFFKNDVGKFIILLDYTPAKSIISFPNLILRTINKSQGVLSLTSNKKLINTNMLVLPGIIPDKINQSKNLLNEFNFTFMLSGILSENRCPELMLKLFSEFPDYQLIITGVIQDEKLVDKYVNNYSNIKYLGFLEYDEYIKVLLNATFSINSRNPNFEENSYNFPSKTLEHIYFNRIIISTMQYEELEGINYFYVKPEYETFKSFLFSLRKKDKLQLLKKYGNQSSKAYSLYGINNWINAFSQIEQNILK